MFLDGFSLFRAGLAVILIGTMAGCGDSSEKVAAKPELLLYCGITMVHPMTEIAHLVEQEQGVKITITQGGSEDLYQSLKTSRQGDLYLPGSASYRKRHLEEGLLGDFVHVGYNQAALMVAKGNPKKVEAQVSSLLREDLSVVICNPESGSIGRETKRILDKEGIYRPVLEKSVYLTTDSRNLNGALKNGDADLIVNWRATAFFDRNRDHMDVLDLDPEQASPKKLVLNILTFSRYPEIARRFMELAESERGQAIFRKYGFLDKDMKVD
jgi:molybdate transport system substrate-binding protein